MSNGLLQAKSKIHVLQLHTKWCGSSMSHFRIIEPWNWRAIEVTPLLRIGIQIIATQTGLSSLPWTHPTMENPPPLWGTGYTVLNGKYVFLVITIYLWSQHIVTCPVLKNMRTGLDIYCICLLRVWVLLLLESRAYLQGHVSYILNFLQLCPSTTADYFSTALRMVKLFWKVSFETQNSTIKGRIETLVQVWVLYYANTE